MNGTVRRRAAIAAMTTALNAVTALAVQRFPETAPAYQKVQTDLAPHL